MGLALLRYVIRLEPLASTDADEVVALATPTVQHYLIQHIFGALAIPCAPVVTNLTENPCLSKRHIDPEH